MKTIYKYALKVTDEQVVKLPKYSSILSVKCQGDTLVLYAFVDLTQKEMDVRSIRIFGTGLPVDIPLPSWTYLDTVMTHKDALHIFYK